VMVAFNLQFAICILQFPFFTVWNAIPERLF
jgi:hypothetical protein